MKNIVFILQKYYIFSFMKKVVFPLIEIGDFNDILFFCLNYGFN